MTRGKQTTALALAGAVALASGAYALGTQAEDGSADAHGSGADRSAVGYGFGPGGPGGPGRPHAPGLRPGFDDLADRLGVSEDALRNALDDIAKERRTDFAQRLADALNIDRAKVQQALENLRPKRPGRPHVRRPEALAAALAKELGVSTAKVRAALEKRRGHPGGPGDLAQDLGVSEQKLHDAFHAVFDKVRDPLPGRPRVNGLAKALGVTEQQLEDAFEQLRADHEKLRDEFAQELAERLNLDPSEVADALEESRPFGPRRP